MTRSRSGEPRRRTVLAAAGVILLATAAVVAAWAAGQTALPPDLGTAAPVASLSVPYEDFDDAHTVDLTATLQESPGLTSRTSGILTGSSCTPGATIDSGRAAFVVDRLPVIALATAQPLIRPVTTGDRGPDVRELQDAFAALGFEGAVDGVVGPQTLRFFDQLRRAAVADAPRVDAIDPAALVWLPSASVAVTDCPVAVGGDVEPGTALAALPPTLTGLRVGTAPTALPLAARTLTLDGVAAEVAPDGVVDPESWDALAATASFRAYALAPDDVVLSGSLRLRDAVRVARLPPSLLRDTADGRVCVRDDGAAYLGDLVSSDLGYTLVRFDDPPSSADVTAPDAGDDPCR